jgi:phosphatidate cytidylyltransferase
MGAALKTFLSRFLSSVTLWGVCATILYWAYEPGLWVLVAALLLRGMQEFYSMLAADGFPHFRRTGLFVGAVLVLGALVVASSRGPEAAFVFESGALLLGVLLVFVRQIFHRNTDTLPIAAVGYTLLGVVYIAYLGSNAVNLVYLTPKNADGQLTGHFYLLFLAAVTKMSDCGAYITGSLIGKHPMIPRVSPKKTWEGFFGALGHSMLTSVILVKIFPVQLSLIGSVTSAACIGMVLGFVAVLGDLAESLLKRSTHRKDSGHFLPGIGGALDLIDSLLFTAPLLYLYLRYAPRF